jgi:hypothetical protein
MDEHEPVSSPTSNDCTPLLSLIDARALSPPQWCATQEFTWCEMFFVTSDRRGSVRCLARERDEKCVSSEASLTKLRDCTYAPPPAPPPAPGPCPSWCDDHVSPLATRCTEFKKCASCPQCYQLQPPPVDHVGAFRGWLLQQQAPFADLAEQYSTRGFCNFVVRVNGLNVHQDDGGTPEQALVLRAPRSDANFVHCPWTLDELILEGYITCKLAHAAVAPHVHRIWITWREPTQRQPGYGSAFPMLHVLSDAYNMSLAEALEQGLALPGVEQQLYQHFVAVARLGILLSDVKPKNQVVRQRVDGAWEVRLIDFTTSSGYAMEVSGWHPECLSLSMLTLSAGQIACCYHRRAFASELALLARRAPQCAETLNHFSQMPPQEAPQPGALARLLFVTAKLSRVFCSHSVGIPLLDWLLYNTTVRAMPELSVQTLEYRN